MEEETKECTNCKRDIPVQNFVMHSVHCQRNIKLCPVCKEPVTADELPEHHERLHSLAPCKHCGESVCGTDLEDHIRDSCAQTMHTCRFCELEVRRGSMPNHEGYCGARTERCEECGEFVMAKYRQLHLASNHGFIKLDDEPDPPPPPQAMPPRLSPRPSRSNPGPASPTPIVRPSTSTPIVERPKRTIQRDRGNDNGFWANEDFGGRGRNGVLANPTRSATDISSGSDPLSQRNPPGSSGVNIRTTDQPQASQRPATNQGGAIRKHRPAPRSPPHKDSRRDLAYQRALQRRSSEERQRQEQTAYNLSVGLPPVLSAAEKLEKLRKMDALQNPATPPEDYKKCLQGRVWKPLPQNYQTTGYVLGSRKQTNTQGSTANKDHRTSKQANKQDRNNNCETLRLEDSGDEIIDSDLELSYFHDDVIVISSDDEITQNDTVYNQARRSVTPNLAVNGDQVMKSPNQAGKSPNQARKSPNQAATRPVTPNLTVNGDQIMRSPSQVARSPNQARNSPNQAAKSPNQTLNNQTQPVQLRYDFKNLRAMSEEEFQLRLQDIQLREQQRLKDDRFNAIKTSLRELRRDLSEVTAPYNASNNAQISNQNQTLETEVQLPCEFCSTLVPASELVLHQTGCRPDLARLTDAPTDVQTDAPTDVVTDVIEPEIEDEGPSPVIPCEFCSMCLPVYLISEHQEMCQREANA